MFQKQKVPKHRKGSTVTVSVGIMFAILVFAMFFLELLRIYDTQYAIEVRAQRAVNMTVEDGMSDVMRAKGYNVLLSYNEKIPTSGKTVQQTLEDNLRECLKVDSNGRCYDDSGKLLYTATWNTNPSYATYTTGSVTSHNVAGISIPITVKMTSNFGGFFGNQLFNWTFTNTYQSTNFRVDDDQRAGGGASNGQESKEQPIGLYCGCSTLRGALMILLYDGIVGGNITQTLIHWFLIGGKEAVFRGESFASQHELLR